MNKTENSLSIIKGVDKMSSLSTGSTLLNLAITGRISAGLSKGRYIWFVGDSSSGKTFIAMTIFAEASINEYFDKFDFIYDGNEGGAMMDISKFFGSKLAKRLKTPGNGKTDASKTVEEFYYNVDDCVAKSKKSKRPFIYILDSENGLSTDAEVKKFKEKKKAHRDEKESTGTMSDGKAKLHSSNLRRLIPELLETDSILIILSQTRDSMNTFGFGDAKTVPGGRALNMH